MKPTHTSFYDKPHNSGFMCQKNFWDERMLLFYDNTLVCETQWHCFFYNNLFTPSYSTGKQRLFICRDAPAIVPQRFWKDSRITFRAAVNKTNQNQFRSIAHWEHTCWKKPIHPWARAKFLCVYVVRVHHVWVCDTEAKHCLLNRQAWTSKQVLLEQLRMRTWGVLTKPHQREAASAASHPSNLIYVTVSDNFMTACRNEDTQGPLQAVIQQQHGRQCHSPIWERGFKLLTRNHNVHLILSPNKSFELCVCNSPRLHKDT